MLISNTKRSCVMHSTGVPPRVSRGHEVWPRVAGTWATSDEDTSRSWQGLPLKTPHSHSSPHAALPQTRLLHTPPPRKFTASQLAQKEGQIQSFKRSVEEKRGQPKSRHALAALLVQPPSQARPGGSNRPVPPQDS